jgi:hypothetical protein
MKGHSMRTPRREETLKSVDVTNNDIVERGFSRVMGHHPHRDPLTITQDGCGSSQKSVVARSEIYQLFETPCVELQ